jgi:hypothetical protein
MFRRSPGKAAPCFSMPMLPFFAYLSGDEEALACAIDSLQSPDRNAVDLAGDGTPMNLDQLSGAQVDWALKQMVQAMLNLGIEHDRQLMQYGTALYDHIGIEKSDRIGDFSETQSGWMGLSVEQS